MTLLEKADRAMFSTLPRALHELSRPRVCNDKACEVSEEETD